MDAPAGALWRHPGLPVELMMEAYERICPGSFNGRRAPDVKALGRAAWDEAGYCLDAPDDIPAGGCEAMESGPDDGDFYPAQLVTWRDA
jgi:hypothetical protein